MCEPLPDPMLSGSLPSSKSGTLTAVPVASSDTGSPCSTPATVNCTVPAAGFSSPSTTLAVTRTSWP